MSTVEKFPSSAIRKPQKYEALSDVIMKRYALYRGRLCYKWTNQRVPTYDNGCTIQVCIKRKQNHLSVQHVVFFMEHGRWAWQDEEGYLPSQPPAKPAARRDGLGDLAELPDSDLLALYDRLMAQFQDRRVDPVRRTKIQVVETEVPVC